METRFGPQAVGVLVKSEDYGSWLAEKMGFPTALVRNAGERKTLALQLAQAASAAGVLPAQTAGARASVAAAKPGAMLATAP